jgi:endonuclease I
MRLSLIVVPLASALFACAALAQIPDGYYDSAQGLSGEELQWALHDIISGHSPCSYNYIWTAFYTTDDRYGDKVWDMHSDVPGGTPPYLYTLGDDQGGSASSEGEGYNREHSWPGSWYGGAAPMNTDLFHIVPSDIYVNSKRANYPYAEVNNPTWTSLNGSRLGPSSTPGYGGTAFEPIDGYKGDFARSYFYMATRYKGEDAGWPGSPMADGADLEDWAVELLLQWHVYDPVSEKELERNEAVYAIQGNRNPFIDHPEFAGMVYDPQLGIETGTTVAVITCSPNPSRESVSINVPLPPWQVTGIRVFDVSGRVVSVLPFLPSEGGGSASVWNCSKAGPGVYFAVAESTAGLLVSAFLVLD